MINALKYSVGGEVFVPKLPAFKVTDLIKILKEKLNADNEIEIIGIRPGEKIHELMINFAEVPKTYKFRDMYVITSSIANYHEIKHAEYMNNENKLTEKDMLQYSSEQAVVSKEEVEKLFKEFGLL